jgi:hypothetical protein
MSTVSPKPVAPKVVAPKSNIVSDSVGGSKGYARPTAGGNAAGGSPEGGSSNAPAGATPGAGAYSPNLAGNPPSTGATQVGPDFGHGATIVVPNSGDRPSGGKDAADLGTVGDSGPQGG